jgi:hypothetical protein
MVYSGHVRQGTVVFDEPIALPEGVSVRIEVSESTTPLNDSENRELTAGQRLLLFAGKAVGLPADAAENHDHYLYGTPKR